MRVAKYKYLNINKNILWMYVVIDEGEAEIGIYNSVQIDYS